MDKIDKYIEDNKTVYEKWRLKIRAENTAVTPINNKMELTQLSRSNSNDFQEVTQTTITKNKSTKNKKLKTITNRINAVLEIEVSEEDLIIKISELQQSKLEDRPELYKEFYIFLRNSVPMFENFEASDKDYEFIDSLIDSPIDSHFLATKIRENASAIMDKQKECRFGNLFVGIKEMSENFKDKYAI